MGYALGLPGTKNREMNDSRSGASLNDCFDCIDCFTREFYEKILIILEGFESKILFDMLVAVPVA